MNPPEDQTIGRKPTPAFLLTSVYLWPFFALWSLNRRSWSGLDRDGFNRFNGIGVLCLLDFFAVLTFLPRELLDALTKVEATGLFLGLLAAHWIWLDGQRGEHLRLRFASAPARVRSLVKAISATAFGGLLVWFFVSIPQPNRAPRPMNLSCGNATEITAAKCDTERGR